MARRGTQAIAVLVLLAILVGLPVALWLAVGNPLQLTFLQSGSMTSQSLTPQDMIKLLACGAWVAWLYFAVVIVLEVINVASRRDRTFIVLPGGGWAHGAARKLVCAALLGVVALPLAAGSAQAASSPTSFVVPHAQAAVTAPLDPGDVLHNQTLPEPAASPEAVAQDTTVADSSPSATPASKSAVPAGESGSSAPPKAVTPSKSWDETWLELIDPQLTAETPPISTTVADAAIPDPKPAAVQQDDEDLEPSGKTPRHAAPKTGGVAITLAAEGPDELLVAEQLPAPKPSPITSELSTVSPADTTSAADATPEAAHDADRDAADAEVAPDADVAPAAADGVGDTVTADGDEASVPVEAEAEAEADTADDDEAEAPAVEASQGAAAPVQAETWSNIAKLTGPQSLSSNPAAPAAGVPVAQTSKTYTVKTQAPGADDCLWDIAERHLGDPFRWREIFELNQNPALGVVIKDPDVIQEGWVLRMPADAVGVDEHTVIDLTEAPKSVAEAATDQPGTDQPAAEQPELPQSGAHAAEADGESSRASQPAPAEDAEPAAATAKGDDVAVAPQAAPAHSGPAVVLPDVAGSSAPTALPPLPSVSTPSVSTGAALVAGSVAAGAMAESAAAGGQAAEAVAAGDTVTVAEADVAVVDAPAAPVESVTASPAERIGLDVETSTLEVATIATVATAGIASVLAGGVLTVLARRRSRQRNEREPGQRIVLPAALEGAVEGQLRTAEAAVSTKLVQQVLLQLGRRVQQASRPYPSVRVMRIRRKTVELYCVTPTPPIAPWTVDDATPLRWSAPLDDVLNDAPQPGPDHDYPFPALVVIGQDEEGGLVLADLEALGTLNVSGQPRDALAAHAAVAVELLTSPWTSTTTLSMYGDDFSIPVLAEDSRVRHVTDLAAEVSRLMKRSEELCAVLSGKGFKSLGEARANEQMKDVWCTEVLFIRTALTPEERELVQPLCDPTAHPGVAVVTMGAELGQWTLQVPPPGADGRLNPMDLPVWPQTLPPNIMDHLRRLMAATKQPAQPGPAWTVSIAAAPQGLGVASDPVAPALSVAVRASEPQLLSDPDAPPLVQLLGGLDVRGARGPEPRTAGQTHHLAVSELLAYVCLAGRTVPVADVRQALAGRSGPWSERTARTRWAQARVWFDAPDGKHTYIPMTEDNTTLVLSDAVRTDWDLFLEFVEPGIGQARLEDLLGALRLVRGEPLEPNATSQLVWAESYRQDMMQAIVDVAHECATRAMDQQQIDAAREAVRVGRLVDPTSELMWQHAFRAEFAARNTDQLRLLRQEWADMQATQDAPAGAAIGTLIDQVDQQLKAS